MNTNFRRTTFNSASTSAKSLVVKGSIGALLRGLIAVCGQKLCSTKRFVDVHTGRLRIARQFAFAPLYDRVLDTDFSKMWSEQFGPFPPPEWQPESEYRGLSGNRSPSYLFLGVFRWQAWILSAFQQANFDTETKQTILRNFVKYLEVKDAQAAQRYALEVGAYASEHTWKEISRTNAPIWLTSCLQGPSLFSDLRGILCD